ncbi:MAG: hypothetical protein LBG27_07700 [Spirochaetaceae bacterium]|jgi:hypothetical protein|nr:hypothetical protein [Spirochaetaceae bacterium]
MKKFFLGMAALVSVSLFLIGCGDPDAGTAGTPGRAGSESVNGTWAVADLQTVIDDAAAAGAKVRLVRVTLNTTGTVDFKNAAIQIVGPFTTAAGGGTVINATTATVAFAEGAGVVLTHANDVLVGQKTALEDYVSGSGKLAAVAAALPSDSAGVTAVGGVTAVKDLTLSATADDILSGLTVYVYGTLTAPATAVAPTGTVKAIGTVSVAGTNAAALANGAKVDLTNATLTNSAAADVTLPATVTVGAVKPGTGKLTLSGGGTSTTIGLLNLGTGTAVDFKAATTALVIGNATGTGTAEFSGAGYTAVTLTAGSLKIGTGGLKTTTSGVVSLGTNTSASFTASTAAITFPADTVLDGGKKTIGLGGALILGEAALTINNAGVLDLKGANLTVADTTITLTSGNVVSSVAGSVISSTGTGAIPLGSDANNVSVTKATLTAGVIPATGIVPIPAAKSITFVTGGTIVVAGSAEVSLPNTSFGAGTYTATGAVVINAIETGDTIVTEGGGDATSKLQIGTYIAFGEATTASTNAATYTLKKSASNKIVLGATANKITIPANADASPASGSGANIAATQYGGIVLGDNGTIELERKVSGNGAGSLTLAVGTTIGTFTETSNYKIASSVNVAGSDGVTTAAVTIGSANSAGVITGVSITIYGATGADSERPGGDAVYASIAKGLSLDA